MTNVIKFNKEVQETKEVTPKAIKDMFTLEKDTEGKPVISGRDLFKALSEQDESKYANWFNQIKKINGLVEDMDYVRSTFQKVTLGGKQTAVIHYLTTRTAKKIAMASQTKLGEVVRDYFLEIEDDYLDYITGRKAFTEDNVQESLENVIEIQEGIVAHFAVGKNTWRKDTDRVVKRLGTMNKRNYSEIRNRAYELLEEREGVNLSTRLNNIKKRLLKNGFTKNAIDKKNRMDVIAQDDKLIQTYIEVVTELASEYKVGVSA